MKKQSQNTLSPIGLTEVKALTQVVKETLATGFGKPRIFSAADLWNIQHRGTSMLQRRRYA